jgi:hypothetical protein
MDPERPRTSLRAPSPAPLVFAALAVVALAAGGLWWFLGRSSPPPAATAQGAAAEEAPAPPAAAPVDPARQRALLEAVSASPAWRRTVGEPELARRWAVVVENLANDVVPRKQLESFSPAGRFTVVRRGTSTFVDPASYARYDAFADVVASVNVDALAIAWAAVRPAVEAAFRALGYPDGAVDAAAVRALRRVAAAPTRDGDLAVVEGAGATWAYADPELERLGDVDKQLLRMGPRNTRVLQEKAREILRALAPGPADR